MPRFSTRFISLLAMGIIGLAGSFISSAALAGNLYNSATGELIFPVITVDENTSYFVSFNLVSEEPLIWATGSIEVVDSESRTAVTYNADTGALWVPELHVDGNLYSLSFLVTDNCDAAACLEPDLASVQNDGREGGLVFTQALTSASTFSCSSCHAMAEIDGFASDGLRRPGHPMANASRRESYKNGLFTDMLDAVNTCLTEWMNASPWTNEDKDWINLLNWVEDQATVAVADPVTLDLVAAPTELEGGSSENGRELFNSHCRVCHGFDGEGSPLAPKITEIGLTASYIAQRVRTSGLSNSSTYPGLTGGIMPFWGADRLSDGELVDIVAYVSAGEGGNVDVGMDDPAISADTGCTISNSKIGQTAVINGSFHQVAGTAVIVDDCTIDISNFSFDGGGIDVRVYVGSGGKFRNSQGGFAISEDLVGVAYSNNTLRLTLPEGRSLDDFDSISIWCVAVGISFGTGFFQ